MKQQLVIFTLEYPDPLLEKELHALARQFDEVFLLPGLVVGSGELPANVKLVELFAPVDLRRPWRLMLRHLGLLLRVYVWKIRNTNFTRYYLTYIRSFIGHLVLEAEKIKPLENFIRQHNLQHAVFYDYWLVDATLALAELKRRRVIQYVVARAHGFDLYHNRHIEQRVPYQLYRIHFLNAVYTISRHGYDYLRERVPAPWKEKIRLNYLGVDTSFTGALPQKTSPRFTVVSCARLIPLKRMRLYLQALREIELPLHCIHFGDGPLRAELEALSSQLPDNIQFEWKGFRFNAEVMSFYRQHFVDAFVSVSESEGLPVSMMEAAAHGIPILACRINGIPEIVTTETGMLLEMDTHPKEIAQALTRIVSQTSFDREKIRNRCRQYFDGEANTKAFAMELKQIAGFPEKLNVDTSYRQCVRCVMNNHSAPLITFDNEGICHFCKQYALDEQKYVPPATEARQLLEQTVAKIKQRGRGKRYDCLLGISGGVDSTYLAYQAHRLGLRCLLVHFDNGWNSELAVNNINNIVNKLGFDLHTFVVDWEEFKDIQLSFLKASVIDIEMVTDHAILTKMYELALHFRIDYILSGTNVVTEAVLPLEWIHNKRDHIHIRAIQKQFGTKPIVTYPLFSSFLKWRVVWRNIQSVSLLNLMPYKKREVKEVITRELGWRDYGGKHYESVFTRFYQGYILPEKFGVDKRIAHLSNLICSGQLTRAEALDELKIPPYDPRVMQEDMEFVLKKFGLSRDEFQELMQRPVVSHQTYPVEGSIYERFPPFKAVRPVWKAIKKLFNLPQ